MLYLDSPVQTGFSYTKPQNGTFDLLTNTFYPVESEIDKVPTNLTTIAVTLSSQDPLDTLNTTQQVQRTVWQFAQIWLQEFPEYKTENKEVNIWGYSYSGFFAPATSAYFQRKNEEIKNGTSTDSKAKAIPLGTIGMNNGCVDSLSQAASFPEYAHNNTYGVQVIDDNVYDAALTNMTKAGGCLDTINSCRSEAALSDPLGHGNNQTVNEICVMATYLCYFVIQGAYQENSNVSPPPPPFRDRNGG
jgi:carboxypeptidase C (cathepsin A)